MDNNTVQPISLENAELSDIDVEALSDFSDVDVTQLSGFGSESDAVAEAVAVAVAESDASAEAEAGVSEPASGVDSEDDVSSSDSESESDADGTVLLYDNRKPEAQVIASDFLTTNGRNPKAEISYLYPVGKGLPWMQLARSKGGVLCDICGEHYGINKEMDNDLGRCLCTKCLHERENLEGKSLKDVGFKSNSENKKNAFVFSLTPGFEPLKFEYNTTYRMKMGKLDFLYGDDIPKEHKYPGLERYWLFYFDSLDSNTQTEEMLGIKVRWKIPKEETVAKLHREENFLILRIKVKQKETGETTVIETRSGPIKMGSQRFQSYGEKFHSMDLPPAKRTQQSKQRRRTQEVSKMAAYETPIDVLNHYYSLQTQRRKASEQDLSAMSTHQKTLRIIELQERLDKVEEEKAKIEVAYLEKVHENNALQQLKGKTVEKKNKRQEGTIGTLQTKLKAARIKDKRCEERHEMLVMRVDRLQQIQERVNMRFRHEFKLSKDQWNRMVKIHEEEFEAERQAQAERQAEEERLSKKKRKKKSKSTQPKKRSK